MSSDGKEIEAGLHWNDEVSITLPYSTWFEMVASSRELAKAMRGEVKDLPEGIIRPALRSTHAFMPIVDRIVAWAQDNFGDEA